MADQPGEFELIATRLAPLSAGHGGALGLADDAALVDVPAGRRLVVTQDALVAGVHFLADDAPEDIAAKVLAVNLSDLAAMAARPFGYLMAMMLPDEIDEPWLARFTDGLAGEQSRFALSLIGGDTVSTPGPLSLAVTALGHVAPDAALLRSGARPGDRVFVSGTIGDGVLGLLVRTGKLGGVADSVAEVLVRRYRRPEPRVSVGAGLAGLANAAIDVSDGLVADLGHVCRASGVGAVIRAPAVPLSAAARTVLDAHPALLGLMLSGGDDYELAVTASPDQEAALRALGQRTGVPMTPIGDIVRGHEVAVVDADGRPITLPAAGYRHF